MKYSNGRHYTQGKTDDNCYFHGRMFSSILSYCLGSVFLRNWLVSEVGLVNIARGRGLEHCSG